MKLVFFFQFDELDHSKWPYFLGDMLLKVVYGWAHKAVDNTPEFLAYHVKNSIPLAMIFHLSLCADF